MDQSSQGPGWRRLAALALLAVAVASVSASAPPAALVVPGLEVRGNGVDPGELLVEELNCVACHLADDAAALRVVPTLDPLLGEAAARIRPDFLRAYILDPAKEKPGTTMPNLLHDRPAAEQAQAADDLVEFLRSLAAPPPERAFPVNRLLIQQGRLLYHQIGCVACHAPDEPATALFPAANSDESPDSEVTRYTLTRLQQTSVALPSLARKYTPAALADFLADPLRVRPSGRMPAMNLNPSEATALAAYLTRDRPAVESLTPPARPVNRRAVERGRTLFETLGCAACHQLGAGFARVKSRSAAAPLATLDANQPKGCLSEAPPATVPRYQFSSSQRSDLRATLGHPEILRRPLTPQARVTMAMAALNCFACHSRNGAGGPTPSRADYFTFHSQADLGDEGRLPPHLTEVGRKLRPDWLREVLLNQGTVRPYMAVRMPQFGAASVSWLVAGFALADGAGEVSLPSPSSPQSVETGRLLVGVRGYSCITCHRLGSRNSLGISVMDLTRAVRRLRFDWFQLYLRNPVALRPGTRMPSFWPEGQATIKQVLAGDTDLQIRAIWSYLSQGPAARPPPGLEP